MGPSTGDIRSDRELLSVSPSGNNRCERKSSYRVLGFEGSELKDLVLQEVLLSVVGS